MEGRGKKRRYARKACAVPLRYRETLASPSPFRGVQVKDISLGGVRFQTDGFIPLNTSLIFELSLPENPRPVRAISRVTWSRMLPSGDRYEVGSQFMEIVPTEKKILEGFLSEVPAGAP